MFRGGRCFYGVEDKGVCEIVVGGGVSEIGVGAIPKFLSAALLPSTQVPTLPADVSR